MVDYSGETYHQQRHRELIENRELRVAWSYFAHLAYMNHVTSRDKVLEFGAGVGNNLLTVKNIAKKTIAVEPSDFAREISTADGIESVASLDRLGNEKFNTILCRHVLEHLENPLDDLKRMHRYLEKDGVLVLVLPRESFKKKPKDNDLNQHLFAWTPRTLNNLIRRAEFTLTDWKWEAFGARQKLLPLYQILGGTVYARTIQRIGHLLRFYELVAFCRPDH